LAPGGLSVGTDWFEFRLAGCHGALRGTYRIVYRIDEQAHAVQVLDIDHRADIYHRPLRREVAKCCPERKMSGAVYLACEMRRWPVGFQNCVRPLDLRCSGLGE
jgi:hypothetical protein